jgi:Mg2+/Co2+ transporter CorB
LDGFSTSILFGILVFLILLSAFFSASETSMMAINRYKLRHLAAKQHKAAQRVTNLLAYPDRLIGVILLGNNFVNILASSIATVIAINLIGEAGIPIAAALLTVVILVFSEVTPKTIAAIHPERVAFPASIIIKPMLHVLYPLVWLLNIAGDNLLKLFGISKHNDDAYRLSSDELRTVVHEAEGMIPKRHQQMLLSILDLEKVSVDDIMVPRHEIVGIDLNLPLESIKEQLSNTQHTRLPIYRENIDNVIGILHLRHIIRPLENGNLTRTDLENLTKDLYFVPEGTPLNTQLLNFQRHKRRIGLVVNEYGDIQGLVTLEDILEEIVGDFTSNPMEILSPDFRLLDDGSYLVDGGVTVRELNRAMKWHLPTDGPKTLNGLILEYLEAIPESGVSLRLDGYPMEIIQTGDRVVKTVRIYPNRWQPNKKLS